MFGDMSAADEIYIVTGRTDMRKSIDGLCAIVEDQLHMEQGEAPFYLFCGKRCDRIKAVLWESDGFVLLYKRMEVQGRFRWPRNQLEVKQLTWQQFDWLMSGLESNNQKHSNLRNDRVKSLCQPDKNGELSTPCIISAIPCKYWVSCFFFIAFYGIIRAVKKEEKKHMAGNSKDSKILAYKDMMNQLNKTISAQTELLQSLQKTLKRRPSGKRKSSSAD